MMNATGDESNVVMYELSTINGRDSKAFRELRSIVFMSDEEEFDTSLMDDSALWSYKLSVADI